jgi:hypothetical protein
MPKKVQVGPGKIEKAIRKILPEWGWHVLLFILDAEVDFAIWLDKMDSKLYAKLHSKG